MTESVLLKEQYKNGANLNARIALHVRFSTATQDFHDWLFDQVDVPPHAGVLELGCGTGQMWRTVASRVPHTWRLVLTDFSSGMLRGLDLALFPNAPGRVQSDAQAIPFAAGTFDAVIANHMLYHVPDIPRALGEVCRVLKDGGKLYAATNGARHMRELDDLARAVGGAAPAFAELSFALENGAKWLAPFFASVERADFPDELHVTEAEPLVAYVRSMRAASGWLTAEREQQLREVVGWRIARDGMIRIYKEAGLFVARK